MQRLSSPLIFYPLLLAAFLLSSGCAHRAVSSPDTAASEGVLVEAAAPTVATENTLSAIDALGDDALNDDPAQTAQTDDTQVTAAEDANTTTAITNPGAVQPTQAELDFAAIYGNGEYDPIADPSLPAPAVLPSSFDPWEPFNRRMHRFNNVVDRRVAKPLAIAYTRAVPRPMRLGVGNFFNNLGQPVSALNALLQGKPKQAGQSLGRFLMNSTLGIGGLFDPASAAKLPNKSEDFGQTLGVWGWRRSRYVELPLFGPRSVRDIFGLAGDAPFSPIRPIKDDKLRVFLQGLQMVDVRTQLLSVDRLREGAADDYSLVRDAWLQRRQYQIFGDRQSEADEGLPDYLRDDDNPTVPVDAMPILQNPP